MADKPHSTQRILDCLQEGRCVMEESREGTWTVRMSRAQVLDLKARGFIFGELGDHSLLMVGFPGPMPQDENPNGEVGGA